jgi:uncharacterized membrane protein
VPFAGRWRRGDERGEALPVAILLLGVFFTVLVAVHVVLGVPRCHDRQYQAG